MKTIDEYNKRLFYRMYFINISILALIFLIPLIQYLVFSEYKDISEVLYLQYYLSFSVALIVVVSLLVLSLFGIKIDKSYYIWHAIASILLLLWLIWGIYQWFVFRVL